MKTILYSEYTEFSEQKLNKNRLLSQQILNEIKPIANDIINFGDDALYKYTKKFDNVSLDNLKVTKEEIERAYSSIDSQLVNIFKQAIDNIYAFHKPQLQKDYFLENKDFYLGQTYRAIERVGLYIPGGTAKYPSSVLMNAIPAKIAGVKEIVLVCPPNSNGEIDPNVLVAADLLNINEIYKIGGSQAIFALTYGTKSIRKVNKIVGPGNIYVSMAKKLVYGEVGIDMIAGPSEILIIADEKANPKYIAADLLSQAEHDINACCILITTSNEIIKLVKDELNKQIDKSKRKNILSVQSTSNMFCFLTNSIEESITLSNDIAPEHLELMIENPKVYLSKIQNAGSIFLGEYTPEPVGDYWAGTNHTLPTSGASKYQSPLGVYDFIKKMSYLEYSKEKLEEESSSIIEFANAETLFAHANAIKVRCTQDE